MGRTTARIPFPPTVRLDTLLRRHPLLRGHSGPSFYFAPLNNSPQIKDIPKQVQKLIFAEIAPEATNPGKTAGITTGHNKNKSSPVRATKTSKETKLTINFSTSTPPGALHPLFLTARTREGNVGRFLLDTFTVNDGLFFRINLFSVRKNVFSKLVTQFRKYFFIKLA